VDVVGTSRERRRSISDVMDPRPLVGEPLSLDLLNTRWNTGGPHDLLIDTSGLATWLRSAGLADRCRADGDTLRAVLVAREAIHAAVEESTFDMLNGVLDHGRVRRRLTEDGPVDDADVADPAWIPAWLAADDYLRLLREAPDRVRACAHPHCVLYFYDTSKNGTRRWCSMAACGNRAKAARHYARKHA
jgi:predicted RNA-binding Zn ribbon-like protein